MSRSLRYRDFQEPKSLPEAYSRISQLGIEIADIGIQLQQPKKSRNEGDWRHKANLAILAKKSEKAFVNRWLRSNTKKLTPNKDSVVEVTAHFKFHRKVAGELVNLLVYAKMHVQDDTEETFEALESQVSLVESLFDKG